MNKAEFITAIADKLEVTKAEAGRSLTAIIDVMNEVFTSHEKLTLPMRPIRILLALVLALQIRAKTKKACTIESSYRLVLV